jgi:hypothetical protein
MSKFPNFIFSELTQAFCKCHRNIQNDEQIYMELKKMKQEGTERVEVYYEWIQKLAHGLQIPTIDNFPTTVFIASLQSYLRITIAGMKRSTLQQHKEVVMLCEERMTNVETRSALSIPQSTKHVTSIKTQSITGKTDKYYINYGMINHNVETCKKKKELTTVVTTKATQPSQKTNKTSSYAWHICGLNGHKVIDCPKFVKMQKMFHGKSVTIVKVQLVVETQTIIADVNVVDVNVTTRSKITKKQVFKDRKPRKAKNVVG